MKTLSRLFENNQAWVAEKLQKDPKFFQNLSREQNPHYLWIGCSDSRVPANEIVQLEPGEMFVHRNIANLVHHTDSNCLSVIQFAVEVLKIPHIIVCGHYGCGGIQAALSGRSQGLIDAWLLHIKDLYPLYQEELDALPNPKARLDRLCEINVLEQVLHVCFTSTVQNAWERGQPLSVHGWIYDLHDGILKDLDLCISGPSQIPPIYRTHPAVR
jgi:carbonic anhydrase